MCASNAQTTESTPASGARRLRNMSDTKGQCEECGKTRVLKPWNINQLATRMLCKACIDDDRAKRSEAATGKAGPKPKRPSQLETVVWRVVLTETQSRKVETELAKQGFGPGRNPALKKLLNSM